MIEIKDMYKIYKMGESLVYALNGVSLTIKDNEFVSIIGPSGSGKSTLMNMLGCLDTPTKGTYTLDGKETSKLDDDELATIRNHKIGFIFQRFNLLPKLTAIENVELPLIYQGLSPSDMKKSATEALNIVGLGDRIHHKPMELSGGQQQRVAIARAIATRPSIILADEPTGALDSKTGIEVLGMLKDLHKNGSTIILITHDNSIAVQAERMIKIKDGNIVDSLEVS